MNTNVKCEILAFTICLVLGSVVPITIGNPGEDPNLTREKLRQDPNLIRGILRRAVENAKKDVRKESELLRIIEALGTDKGLPVSRELLPDFISFLKEKDPYLQVLGAHGLYVLKSPKSKEALTEYLKGKDFAELATKVRAGQPYTAWEIRAAMVAILTLGEIGDKSAIPLLESLRGAKLQFEWGGGPVERALAKLGPEGIRSLSNLGPKADYSQISKATAALWGVSDPNMVPALIETVKDANCAIEIRVAALGALGNMKDDDAIPFILATMTDAVQPKYLRISAAVWAGRTHRLEAEEAILKILDDPNCDSSSRISCLMGLVRLNSEKYMPKILKIVIDESAPLEDRKILAGQMANAMEPKELTPHAEMLRMGIKAVKKDGSPADEVRVYMWKALHRATGEEPPLELIDEKLAYEELRYDFEMRFRRENIDAPPDKIQHMVNEKIKSIVVKWQPQKESEKP